MTRPHLATSLAATLVLTALAPRPAPADPGDPAAFAIVVGSNPGGPGQAELRFAEDDARRVAEVLRELGGYQAADVHLLLRPTPAQLRAAVDEVAGRVAAEAAAGRQAMVFFYYSGHARATALNLGREELPLGELRERLLAVPATLTVVVLDACQSGAFSRIKGAEPAGDFSFNSLAKLSATGVAVLASSTGSELSQESDRLGASYFTHHLLVGLRGGGDRNDDGRVSLDEAYHYAYHQTLAATAATSVGSQHVSLEVDLKGQGDVPLTYPQQADARLELPAALAADVLVQRLPAQAVIAELHKSAGAAVRLALPTGAYRVLLRTGRRVDRCELLLRTQEVTTLRVAACELVPEEDTARKGGPGLGDFVPTWGLELSAGIGAGVDDDYTQRLRDFGYTEQFFDLAGQLALGVTRQVTPDLEVVGELSYLGSPTYTRETEIEPLEISWATATAGAHLRASRALAGGTLVPFAQAGGGLARARTRFSDEADRVSHETFWGAHLAGAVGLQLMHRRGFGAVVRATYVWSPAVENLIGDVHDGGGLFLAVGARYAF